MRVSSALTFSSLAAVGLGFPLALRNTVLNEFLTALLNNLPDVNETIDKATTVITDLDTLLGKVTDATTTYNQLTSSSNSSCADYTLIFARGTAEPGNFGVLVGPPFVWALQDILGSSGLTIQGVNDYSASVAGYLAGGDADGSANMYASCLYKLLQRVRCVSDWIVQGLPHQPSPHFMLQHQGYCRWILARMPDCAQCHWPTRRRHGVVDQQGCAVW